ncbi:MAG: hypothetical protein ACYC21_14855 [Eubacteriales bacterium]
MINIFYIIVSIVTVFFLFISWAYALPDFFYQEGVAYGFLLSPIIGIVMFIVSLVIFARTVKGISRWAIVESLIFSLLLPPLLTPNLGVKISKYALQHKIIQAGKKADDKRQEQLNELTKLTGLKVVDFMEGTHSREQVFLSP